MKTIQVFEHERLRIGERGFKQQHFDALLRFNDRHGQELIQAGYRQVVFRQFVGVIQLETLCIEILPKADRRTKKQSWRNALLTMLESCSRLRVFETGTARQSVTQASLMELFFESFLRELRLLLRQGLTRQYYREEANRSAWKGKLVTSRHFRENVVHRERFYTAQDIYGQDHRLHQILKATTQLIHSIGRYPHLITRCNAILLDMEMISSCTVQARDFTCKAWNRKTERYRYALQLAQLIWQHYSPNLQTGETEAIGILFDMNKLFEDYVYQLLRQGARGTGIRVQSQNSRPFWRKQTIRPDLLISYPDGQKVVVDTKWKYLSGRNPSSADLRQIFAYNEQFGTRKGVLLYPEGEEPLSVKAFYRSGREGFHEHACHLLSAAFFDKNGKGLPELGKVLLKQIKSVQ